MNNSANVVDLRAHLHSLQSGINAAYATRYLTRTFTTTSVLE